jgi:hypothetical protein
MQHARFIAPLENQKLPMPDAHGLTVTEYRPAPLTTEIPCEWEPPKQTDRAPLPVYPLPGDLPILRIEG